MASALDGIKVLDLSNYIAGPYAAMLLGDQGAEIIKLERPGGDPYRTAPGFAVWNRGKRSITADLTKKDGQQVARELAARADILLHSFRPGVPERLGVGYEALKELNPRLIYISITGWGEKGPFRDKPGYEPLIAAFGGAYIVQGSAENPTYTVLPYPSYFTALLVPYYAVTALLVRKITGRGQKIEMPLLNGILEAASNSIVDFPGVLRVPRSPLGTLPVYRLFKTADDWLFLGIGNVTFWARFALLLGHEEWLTDPRFEGAPWAVAPEHRQVLVDMVSHVLAAKSRDEWIALFRENDIPASPVLTVEEFLGDPQVLANKMVVELDDPVLGKTRQMGIGVTMPLTPGRIKGPAPTAGQHTDEVLGALGYSVNGIAQLKANGTV